MSTQNSTLCRITIIGSAVGHPAKYTADHVGLSVIGRPIGNMIESSFLEMLTDEEIAKFEELNTTVRMLQLSRKLGYGPNAISVRKVTVERIQ